MASVSWQVLLRRQRPALRWRGGQLSFNHVAPRWVLPGSFNPLHRGHQQMATWVAERFGERVEYELSIVNVDKPPLEDPEIDRRLSQFAAWQTIWLTRAARFVEKAELFAGATFLIGADTLARIGDPRYYSQQRGGIEQTIDRFQMLGCRFLVFGRQLDGRFVPFEEVDIPPSLAQLCDAVPEDEFREDISSTRLRRRSADDQ